MQLLKQAESQTSLVYEGQDSTKILQFLEKEDVTLRFCRLCEAVITPCCKKPEQRYSLSQAASQSKNTKGNDSNKNSPQKVAPKIEISSVDQPVEERQEKPIEEHIENLIPSLEV